MTSAAATASLPTRSEIEEWSTSHLSDAATSWRSAATASEGAFDKHRQNISSPGGTTWEGDAKDAALDRVTKDVAVVGRQSDVLREAADLAENGAHDIKAAKDKAVEAITAAENDGFIVGEDLSVTDTREYDINTIAERNRALAEHTEDIRWAAEQLVQADKLVGDRLQAKSADLEGIRFEGEGDGRDGEPTVQLVDNKVQDKPDEDRKDESGDKPAEQATGQIGPFAVPKSVEDAAKRPGEKPPTTAAADSGHPRSLEDMLLPEGRADTPGPRLDPAKVEEFKAQARKMMQRQGVPADEIERRLNTMVAEAQKPMEPYLPPEKPALPKPGFDEGAGDTLRGAENFVRDLLGQDGMESFKEAWKDVGAGVVETVKDPYGTLVRGIDAEVKSAIDNPAYWAGGKVAEAGIAGATAPFGGELAAVRGALDDVAGAGIPHDVVHPPHVDTPAPPVEHPAPVTPDAPTGHSAPPPVHTPLPDDGLNHVSAESGGPGAWNQELHRPAPLTHYTVDDRFSYTTDSNSRVGHAEMTYDQSHEPGERNGYQQRIAGGPDRLPGDEGGHIFGTQFGGPGEGINITAMRDTLNSVGTRDYYNLEQQWRQFAEQGSQVQVKVDITYPDNSMRPDSYAVKTYVDGQLNSTYHFDN